MKTNQIISEKRLPINGKRRKIQGKYPLHMNMKPLVQSRLEPPMKRKSNPRQTKSGYSIFSKYIALALVILAAAIPGLAQPNDQDTIQPDSINRLVFTAHAKYKINTTSQHSKSIYAAFINESFRQTPSLTADALLPQIKAIGRAEQARLLKASASIEHIDALQPALSAIYEALPTGTQAVKAAIGLHVLRFQLGDINNLFHLPEVFPLQQGSLYPPINFDKFQDDVWNSLWTLANSNSEAKKVVDAILTPFLGVSTNDNASVIFTRTPDFSKQAGIAAIRLALSETGSLATDTHNLKELLGKQIDVIEQRITKEISTLAANKNTGDASKSASGAQRAEVEGTRAGISLLASLLEYHDRSAANTFRALGGASVDLWSVISKYRESTMGPGSRISGIILTGNVVSIALNIVNSFQGSGPTAEELILKELHQLQNDIAALGKEMGERFDHVDQTLNLMWNGMNKEFNLINYELLQQGRSLDAIQNSLAETQWQIARLGSETRLALRDGFDRPFTDAYEYCLNGENVTSADVERFLFSAKSYAVTHSFDALSIDPAYLSALSKTDQIQRLKGDAINNIPLILSPEAKGKIPRLPNPLAWAMGARAYTAVLLTRYSMRTKAIDPSFTDAIIAVGEQFEDVVNRLFGRQGDAKEANAIAMLNHVLGNR